MDLSGEQRVAVVPMSQTFSLFVADLVALHAPTPDHCLISASLPTAIIVRSAPITDERDWTRRAQPES
jgi:hypothetical protein